MKEIGIKDVIRADGILQNACFGMKNDISKFMKLVLV